MRGRNPSAAPGLEDGRGRAGFRNVLVHEYLAIDHALAHRAIQHELGDLEALVTWATEKLSAARILAAKAPLSSSRWP